MCIFYLTMLLAVFLHTTQIPKLDFFLKSTRATCILVALLSLLKFFILFFGSTTITIKINVETFSQQYHLKTNIL
jgi:hypothetical protein